MRASLIRRAVRALTASMIGTLGLGLSPVYAGASPTITQVSPTSGDAISNYDFTEQLLTSDTNAVTFSATSQLPSGVSVSQTGVITADGSTPTGNYTLSGSDADATGLKGSWTYALTVLSSPSATLQSVQETGPTMLYGSTESFQITFAGNLSVLTYYPNTAQVPSGVTVSAGGTVSVSASTADGVYSFTGYATDDAGDEGSWSVALTVNNQIIQKGSTSGTTAQGTTLSVQLSTNDTATVTYSPDTSVIPSGTTVSQSGLIQVSNTTHVGSYDLTGGDTDSLGNAGQWNYSLVVTNTGITQLAPTSGASAAETHFTDQLATSDLNPVNFEMTSLVPWSAGITLSTSGLITSTMTVPENTYTLQGHDSDGYGNTGSWTYTLSVESDLITQSAPTSGTSVAGAASSAQLTTTDAYPITYTATASSLTSGVTVSKTGVISIAGSVPMGTYALSGTDVDTLGATGLWSFSLSVTSDGATLNQSPPTGATVVFGSTASVQLVTTDQLGVETFTSADLPTGVSLSTSGLLTVSAQVPPGSYAIRGATSDTFGGTGSWALALTVTAPSPNPPITQLANAITVTTPPPTNARTGGNWTPDPEAWSRGPVTLQTSTPRVCTVEGSVVNFITSGTCVTVFTSPGMGAYSTAPVLKVSIHVASAGSGAHETIVSFAGPELLRPGVLSARVRNEVERVTKVAASHQAKAFSLLWTHARGLTRQGTLAYVHALRALITRSLEQREHRNVTVQVHAVSHLKVVAELRYH